MSDAETLAGCFQIGADQQRFAVADHIFRESVARFARALRQDQAVPDFELEADLISFLKSDIEVTRIEDLSEFNLDGAKNLILVDPGANSLLSPDESNPQDSLPPMQ